METDKKPKPKTVRLDEELAFEVEGFSRRIGLPESFIIRRFIRAGLRSQNKHALLLSDDDIQSKTGVA